jgi:hypothetical protein
MGAEALSVGDVPRAATHLAVFFHLLGDTDEKKAVLEGVCVCVCARALVNACVNEWAP